MTDQRNPLGRQYSADEWAAARRVGLTVTQNATYPEMLEGTRTVPGGPLLYATGDWHPTHARQETLKAMQAVTDWQIVENAMRREWKKELPHDHPTA